MKTTEITSLQNSHVKHYVTLAQAHVRKKEGLFPLSGMQEILTACQAGVELTELYICQDRLEEKSLDALYAAVDSEKIDVFNIDERVAQKVTYGERKDAVVAVAKRPHRDVGSFRQKKIDLYVVIEGVEKPGNLGAILRTCDACDVSGVFLCESQTDLYNPNVIRSSLGAVFFVPTVVAGNQEVFKYLKEKKIQIVVTNPSAQQDYTDNDLTNPLAIVVGLEQKGLSDFWMKAADLQVGIPMRGVIDSLNVSVSTAVILYEAMRQRKR